MLKNIIKLFQINKSTIIKTIGYKKKKSFKGNMPVKIMKTFQIKSHWNQKNENAFNIVSQMKINTNQFVNL